MRITLARAEPFERFETPGARAHVLAPAEGARDFGPMVRPVRVGDGSQAIITKRFEGPRRRVKPPKPVLEAFEIRERHRAPVIKPKRRPSDGSPNASKNSGMFETIEASRNMRSGSTGSKAIT